MDYKNKSILLENITSFDVNKAIQRSLTKALARHGLGLYVYAGEDLPEIEIEKITPREAKILKNIVYDMNESERIYQGILQKYNVKTFKDLTVKQRTEILQVLSGSKIALPVAEKANLTSRKKHRELRTGVSRATMFLTEERRYKNEGKI